MPSPFGEFLKSINYTKEDLMEDPLYEKEYMPFLINRTLSYFPELIDLCQEMNLCSDLPNIMQYHFYLNTVPRGKRFKKWDKKDYSKDLDVVKEYYQYSTREALDALQILTKKDINKMKKSLEKGGKK